MKSGRSRSCAVGPQFLSKRLVDKLRREAAARGVSTVARSPRGFLAAWDRGLDDYWCRRRAAFVKRHMAQVKKKGEPLFRNGSPTRRHLALAMWAYSPNASKLAAWAKRR